MSVGDFMWLCAATFALLYIGWRLWDESHPRVQSASVDTELDECREAIQCVGQHHTTEPEEYQHIEEPQLYLVHEVVAKVRQA